MRSSEIDFFLDLRSFGRRGPSHRDRLTPTHIAAIARTVRRAPEVMIKISGGAVGSKGALAHLKYIDRHGRLDIETDEGIRLRGKGSERSLLEEWQLDLDEIEGSGPLRGVPGRRPTKLTHNIVLSMPAGTPQEGLLAAARDFAREEFALKHRYGMVLHIDQAHPHVHLVVRAVGEDGKPLRIRRETLRRWRSDFATHPRAHGINANATPRAVRGRPKLSKPDGIYRAMRRGASTYTQEQLHALGAESARETVHAESGRARLRSTREAIERGWRAIAEALEDIGHEQLAGEVRSYSRSFQAVRTERELLRAGLLTATPRAPATREQERVR